MKWKDKKIEDLNDFELREAELSLNGMHEFAETRKADPKFAERFKNQTLPNPNPAFIQLKAEIAQEIEKRKNTNG